MTKRIKILPILLFCILLISGCSAQNNNSAENVAKAMVKKLSKDNYQNIGNLFYQEEGTYFDDEVFKKIIENKKLNISGNRKIKVTDVGSEITNSDGNVEVKVKIEIDKDRTFNLNTIEVNGKWYVYDEDFYDKGIIIFVPNNAKVKINGKELNKSYFKDSPTNISLTHPNSTSRTITSKDVYEKAYYIKNILKGKYDITVESDKTIKDVIYSYSDSSNISSTNYTYSKNDDNIIYNMGNNKSYDASEEQKNNVEQFIQKFYNDFITSINNHSEFNSIEKYFLKDSRAHQVLKENFTNQSYYKYTKSNPYKYTSSYSSKNNYSYYYSDFKIENVKTPKVYYYNDDVILAAIDVKISYKYYYNGKPSNKNSTYYGLVELEKVNDTYAISKEYNLLW